MPIFAVDLTACWRPRVGMVTLSVELARALVARSGDQDWVLLASREPVDRVQAPFMLSPYRHELLNKLLWLPVVERSVGAGAILYPYWPAPPRRHRDAPPAVIFVHDLAFRFFPEGVPWQQRLYLGRLLPRVLPAAAAVIVPSQATRSDLLEAYPAIRPERVHVVVEGAGHLGEEAVAPPPPLVPGRYVLSVGTIEPRKNIERLILAYRLLRRKVADPPDLVLVGAIPYWADRAAVRLLGDTPGVHHLGHVDDATLLGLYRGALALAFPSLYEGFGLPLLEAMREGVAALVSTGGALSELSGGTAVEVDPRDAGAIASGLQRLVEDAELRERLGGAARRRAAGYTWDRAAAHVIEIMRAAASR